MVGIILLSHGDMASGMVDSIHYLRGEVPAIKAVCLHPHQTKEAYDVLLEDAVDAVDTGDGILAFADIHGGTPANRALLFAAKRHDVEVFTGTNMPLVLEAITARETMNIHEICELLDEVSPSTVVYASRQLRENLTAENETGFSAELQ